MNLLVKNAKLREKKGLVDIEVEGGAIKKIAKKISRRSGRVIDAEGRLVAPTFIDPHLHLDKALISEVVRENKSGTLAESIEIIWNKKKNYKVSDIAERACRVMEWGILNGATFFRTHVDVDTIGGLTPLEGILAAREKMKGLADVQIVAFPQEGIIQDEGTEELMYKAMDMGADVVGGMPYNEMTEDDSKRHIDICFKIAKKFDADIDMHVDEDDSPFARTLQYLAAKTIKEKWFGRVTAGHTCALASYDDNYAAKIIGMLKKAKMNMITNPATNLMLEGRRDKQPKRRGITRVKELIDAGVNVCYGQDCLKDTFYPTWGQEDMLEVGLITAHAAQFTMPREIETLFDMPTINAAKVLRLKDYGIKEGNPASFNIIDAPTVQEAFRTRADRLFVIKNGKIIARTKTTRELKKG
ncbi:MAG: amidohydrolase family protein [Elusimicrobia bacterium]|nr:amidohydrolase family protein [Elusimicrobiota bacterium]